MTPRFDQRSLHKFERRTDEIRDLHAARIDRKSTRLNSSHQIISYAVFCLKKKNKNQRHRAIGLTLVTAAIASCKSFYLERAIQALSELNQSIESYLLVYLFFF